MVVSWVSFRAAGMVSEVLFKSCPKLTRLEVIASSEVIGYDWGEPAVRYK